MLHQLILPGVPKYAGPVSLMSRLSIQAQSYCSYFPSLSTDSIVVKDILDRILARVTCLSLPFVDRSVPRFPSQVSLYSRLRSMPGKTKGGNGPNDQRCSENSLSEKKSASVYKDTDKYAFVREGVHVCVRDCV